jgi:lysophospholipase L1-like esterase
VEGFTYANLAIRGRLMSQVWQEQVDAAVDLRPELVSVAAGVNDTLRGSFDLNATANALERSVRALRGSGADVLLFEFGDPSRRSFLMTGVAARIEAMNAAARAIAAAHGCYLASLWACEVYDHDDMWDRDRLHLTPVGHRISAAAALEGLGLGDGTWRTPLPTRAPAPALVRGAGHARWAVEHLGPWAVRRVRGRSSGDGLAPKVPTLTPWPRHDI